MSVLDLAVARAAFQVRQLERALHDSGCWEVAYGPFTVPACRITYDDRVTFLAHFPSHCWLMEPEPVLSLLCDGEIVGTRTIVHPGDGNWECEWSLAISEPASVS